jgi:hypothetical protein
MAALYSRYPLDRRLCGPQSRSGLRGYRKKLLAFAGIEPQSSSLQSDTIQTEIRQLPLRQPKVHNSPSLDPTLSLLTPVHAHMTDFLKTHFNIILHLHLDLQVVFLHSGFQTKMYDFLIIPCMLHVQTPTFSLI